jgi:beta-phosphoglucomutase family hydrolase
MKTIPVKALIFDMDGTLVDNMRFHQDAWGKWFRAKGLPFDDAAFFKATAGRHNDEIFAIYFPEMPTSEYPALVQSKELMYQQLYAPHKAVVAGLIPFLEAAKAAGIPCAVGTAAPQMNIDFILEPLGLAPYFQAVVNPSATIRGKPHPDIFAEAARRLGVSPADCVVFEDAPMGLQAAHNGGMRSVALTTHLNAGGLAVESPAHIMNDYTQIRLSRNGAGFQLEFTP